MVMRYIFQHHLFKRNGSSDKEWEVKPELEVFDLGHIRFAKEMIKEV